MSSSDKRRLHYHSDCEYFAGCERMLINFWRHEDLRARYTVTFSYRDSAIYTSGLFEAITPDFPVYPLTIPPVSWPRKNFQPPFHFISKLIRVTFRLLTKYPLFFFEVYKMFGLFRKVAPDVVHLNNGGYPGARSVRAAAVGARLAGAHTVAMVVNNLAEDYSSIERLTDYFIDRAVVHCVTKFVTGSSHAAQRLKNVLRVPEGKVVSINNGVKIRSIKERKSSVKARLGLPPEFNGIVLGMVALLEERKGHSVLLNALQILKNRIPDLEQHLIVWVEGEGPLQDSLVDSVSIKSLNALVNFVGTERHVFDFINALDCYVLPSIESEDFPNVVIEAMSLGKPVIASALAGTVEQVSDQFTGYLVEPANPLALADKIENVIQNRSLLQDFGRAGEMKYSTSFTADVSVAKYLDLYEGLREK